MQKTFALPPVQSEAIDILHGADPRALYKMKLYLLKGTPGWQVTEGLLCWLDFVLDNAEKAGRFRHPKQDEKTGLFDDDYYNLKHNPYIEETPPPEEQAGTLLPQYLFGAWCEAVAACNSTNSERDELRSQQQHHLASLQHLIAAAFGVTTEMLQATMDNKEKPCLSQ